jgi:hypothetical protein
MRGAGLLVLALTLGACQSSSARQAPLVAKIAAHVMPRFGPVIGAEVIGGRADAGEDVLLLAGGVDLVRLTLSTRSVARVRLRIPPADECWNLARLDDGSLWTLRGRRTLSRIASDGSIEREWALPEPHFGLFAVGDRLLFQRADFAPPGPALLAGTAGGPRQEWSAITTRVFPAIARASAAALNMITCGATEARERACWFPDEPALFLVSSEGTTRRLLLDGLDVVSPEILLTSDNPARPVRDSYVDAGGAVWVLSSGKAPPGAPEAPGGWILARYGSDGVLEGLTRLSEAVRLILHVDTRSILVLTSTGMVAEVSRW